MSTWIMNSDKPHIQKVDEEGTGIGSPTASCWLDYSLKTNY